MNTLYHYIHMLRWILMGNSVFQEYYHTHQLIDATASEISWIGSIQIYFLFATMLVGGPLFDQYGAVVRIWLFSCPTLFNLCLFLVLSKPQGTSVPIFGICLPGLRCPVDVQVIVLIVTCLVSPTFSSVICILYYDDITVF